MERRDFLKTSCSLCVGLSAGLMMSGLSSCSSLPLYKTEVKHNTIRVPQSLFAENDVQIIRPDNFEYDIALHKQRDGNYAALLLRCTHAANQLTLVGGMYRCNLHGSMFDEEGFVAKGPAERPLTKFATEVSDNDVVIFLNERDSER